MDCTTCYCRMPRCPLFGQVAPQAQFTWHDWHREAPRWRLPGLSCLGIGAYRHRLCRYPDGEHYLSPWGGRSSGRDEHPRYGTAVEYR
jgi:hypothetical protein